MISTKWDLKSENKFGLRIYADDILMAAAMLLIKEDKSLISICAAKTNNTVLIKEIVDLAARMLIRRSYELGYIHQYILAQAEYIDVYKEIGFTTVIDVEARSLSLMEHKGDICGNC